MTPTTGKRRVEDLPLIDHNIKPNLTAIPVFTAHAENIEASHITAQAVKTKGVPENEKHSDQSLVEKTPTPAEIATVGMNNKKEVLNDLSVKHANNHKLSSQKIAGKKPLW